MLLAAPLACGFDFNRRWDGGVVDFAANNVVQDGGRLDGKLPGDLTPDQQPPADAGPDAPTTKPQICWTTAVNSKQVDCPGGMRAISGGAICDTSLLTSSQSRPANGGWKSSCIGAETPGFTEAICADGSWNRREQANAVGTSVTVSCGGNGLAMGGGCQCTGSGALATHQHVTSPEGWRCACDEVGVSAEVFCTSPAVAALLGRWTGGKGGWNTREAGVNCASGKGAIAGGCASQQALYYTSSLDQPAGWGCGFDVADGDESVAAICIDGIVATCP